MELVTRRFGTIEVLDENALTVPAGIPGFPDMRRATLLSANLVNGDPSPSDPMLFWLQDIDNGDLAFLCLVPWGPFPEYDFEFEGDDLGIDDEADVRILNIITMRRDGPANNMTANLRAPLVVDVAHQCLHQVILTDSRWPVSAPIASLTSAEVR